MAIANSQQNIVSACCFYPVKLCLTPPTPNPQSSGTLEVQWTNSQEPPQVWLIPITSLLAGPTLENFRPLTLMLTRSDGFLTQWCFSWNTVQRVRSQGPKKVYIIGQDNKWLPVEKGGLVQRKEHGLWESLRTELPPQLFHLSASRLQDADSNTDLTGFVGGFLPLCSSSVFSEPRLFYLALQKICISGALPISSCL